MKVLKRSNRSNLVLFLVIPLVIAALLTLSILACTSRRAEPTQIATTIDPHGTVLSRPNELATKVVTANVKPGNSIATAKHVALGTKTKGELETETDADVFAFDAVSGKTYQINIDDYFHSNFAASVTDEFGNKVAKRTNRWYMDDHHDCWNNLPFLDQMRWQAKSDGTHYLRIASNPDGRPTFGEYSFYIHEYESADDHSDLPSDATQIDIGQTVEGKIEWGRDVDQFRFNAESGYVYTIKANAITAKYSAVQSLLLDVVDAESQPGSSAPSRHLFSITDVPDHFRPEPELVPDCDENEDHRGEYPRRGTYQDEVTFISQKPNEYFISVSQNKTFHPLQYTLSIESHQGEDIGETPEHAADFQINEIVKSNVELTHDADLFRFKAVARQIYEIDFTITGTARAEIAILHLHNGNLTLRSKFDRRYYHWKAEAAYDPDVERRFTGFFLSQESDDLYLMVRVTEPTSKKEEYQFTVKPVRSFTDNDESTEEKSTELTIDQEHHFSIDFVEDEEFFHFYNKEGKEYLVSIESHNGHDPIAQVWYEGDEGADDWDRNRLGFNGTRATFRTWDIPTKHYIRIIDTNRADYTITVNELR